MPKIRESVHINRPVDEVFAYATDPDNQTLIASNMIEYDLDAPAMAKGARATGTTRVAGKRIHWTSEVAEYDEGSRVSIRSIDAPMDFEITWSYEQDGDATLVTFEQVVPDTEGFFGKLTDPIVTKMYSRDVRSNLENLKTLLEES